MFKSILCAALVIGLAGTASAAPPIDMRFPGSMCRVQTGTTDGQYSEAFGVFNVGANPINVECPIPFDFGGASGLQLLIFYTAYDRNSTQNVSCRFLAADPDGLNPHFTNLAQTSGASQFPSQTIPIGAVNVVNGQILSMQCTLPAAASLGVSHLVSYRVQPSP